MIYNLRIVDEKHATKVSSGDRLRKNGNTNISTIDCYGVVHRFIWFF